MRDTHQLVASTGVYDAGGSVSQPKVPCRVPWLGRAECRAVAGPPLNPNAVVVVVVEHGINAKRE